MRKIIFLTENMLDQHNENYKEALKYKKRKKESVIAGTAGGVLTGVGATALAAGAVSNPFILLGLLVAGPTMLVIRKFLKDKNKEIEHDLSIEAVGKILKFSKRIKRNVRARPIYNKLIYELQKKNPDEDVIIKLSEDLKDILREDGFNVDKIYRNDIM